MLSLVIFPFLFRLDQNDHCLQMVGPIANVKGDELIGHIMCTCEWIVNCGVNVADALEMSC